MCPSNYHPGAGGAGSVEFMQGYQQKRKRKAGDESYLGTAKKVAGCVWKEDIGNFVILEISTGPVRNASGIPGVPYKDACAGGRRETQANSFCLVNFGIKCEFNDLKHPNPDLYS